MEWIWNGFVLMWWWLVRCTLTWHSPSQFVILSVECESISHSLLQFKLVLIDRSTDYGVLYDMKL